MQSYDRWCVFEKLNKKIRTTVNMSQEQFAAILGTTPLSINRWENGKTEPNKMTQKQLYQFCKDNSIDLAKIIIDSKTYENTDNMNPKPIQNKVVLNDESVFSYLESQGYDTSLLVKCNDN